MALGRIRTRIRKRTQRRLGGAPIWNEPNPDDADTLVDFRFFAIVKTWMDEDIIEATVKNALTQGAEAVFLVDNGSTDGTIERAEAAGATIAEVFTTEVFNERLTQAIVNGAVARESLRSGAEHVWWLYLDADEFPEGPQGMTLRQYLGSLDKRFRMVGSTTMNHLPTGKPEYVTGFHPIDFQPWCYEYVVRWTVPCGQNHWKHPLIRFDRRGHYIECMQGFHSARCPDEPQKGEPSVGVITHHFQYRAEERTRAKLRLMTSGSERAGVHVSTNFDVRSRSLDAIYEQKWHDVETASHDRVGGLNPRPRPHLERVKRWYAMSALDAVKSNPDS